MRNLRSMLFMPGNNPGMLVSADALDADAIIYDLEDAVALEEKDAARQLVHNALLNVPFNNSYITVRINPIDSPYWQDDLDAILPTMPDGLVIPKASVEAVEAIESHINEFCTKNNTDCDELRFFMLIESAAGIINADKIAQASDRIDGLLFGAEDYSVSMGISRTKEAKEISYARYHLATVARAFDLDAIDTPFTDIDDTEGLIEDTKFVKSIGYNGRLVINPRQVQDIHKVFSPTAAEIEQALAILDAAEEARKQGVGVFSFKGKMVDKPIITRAENLVNSAKGWGLI